MKLKKIESIEEAKQFLKDIETESFDERNIPILLQNLYLEKKYHGTKEEKELKKEIYRLVPIMAKYYNCKEEEILIGDWSPEMAKSSINFKIIIGDLKVQGLKQSWEALNLQDVIFVAKSVDLSNADMKGKNSFTWIGDDLYGENTKTESMNHLEAIGKSVIFINGTIGDLSQLTYVGKDFTVFRTTFEDLENLNYVGRNINLQYSEIPELTNLETVVGEFNANCTTIYGDIDHIYTRGNKRITSVTFEKIKREKLESNL